MYLCTTNPDLPRGFKVPMYPVLPILGVLACFGLIFSVEKKVLIFFGWYVLGAIVLYFIYGMRNSRLAKGEQQFTTPAIKELHDEPPMVP
jgi:APA family basic amino acid/polyamine antiporter